VDQQVVAAVASLLARVPDYVTTAKGRYDSPLLRSQEVSMVNAYILIQTEVGKAAQVAKEVASIKGVTSAEDVTGPYDVIVRAEARNVDELGKLVVAKIQAVEGITRTLTCPVVHL
jgi:DNA-binding Lrp family transcriptional regulator